MADELGRFEVVEEPAELGRFSLVTDAPDAGRFELVEDEPLIPPVVTEAAKEFGQEAVGIAEAAASIGGGFLEFLNPLPGLAAAGKEEIAQDLSNFEIVTAGSPLGASFEALETDFANSFEEATANIEKAQELSRPWLVYEPQTEAGTRAQERVGNALDFLIGKPARTMGELAQQGTEAAGGGQTLGAAIGAGINIGAELLGFSVLLGGAKHSKLRSKVKRGEELTPVEKVEYEKGLAEVATELETRVREAPMRAQKAKTRVQEEATDSVRADALPPEPVREVVRDVAQREVRDEATIQREIDTIEDRLIAEGIDITKLFDSTDRRAAEILGKDPEFKPQPRELTDLLTEREAIFTTEKGGFVDAIVKDSGLSEVDTRRGLSSLGLEENTLTHFFDTTLKRWDRDTTINLNNIYREFSRDKDTFVEFRITGTAEKPTLSTIIRDADGGIIRGRKADPATLRKVEGVFNAVEKARGGEPIRLTLAKEQPITLRELPPEEPAAGGLPIEAELPKMAGGINLERVSGPKELKRLIHDTSTLYKGAITEARRGKITHDLTREMADSLGVSERAMRKIAKRKPGGVLNAEEMLAARDWLNSSGREVKKISDRWLETRAPEDLVEFRRAQARHAALQAEVAGVATETGRALSSLRIASQEAKNLDAILDSLGGKDISEQMIEKFARIDPSDQLAVNKFLANAHKATTGDMLFEIWVNALLSSPTTHVVNTTSNALTFLSKLPEEALASSIDFSLAKATGRPRERFFGEVPQHMYGLWEGIKDGTRKGVQAFITEIPSQGVSKLEQTRFRAVPGVTGRTVRIPGRALIAMDEFFKAINFSTELHSEAYRLASKEGLKGRARARRMAEVIQDPPIDILKRSQEEMLYRVFQKDLGAFGKTLQRARVVDPSGVLKWIVPFVRTPINIAKFGLERSPLYFPLIGKRALKGELAKGALADELAKATMGSGVAATIALLSKEGRVTGAGPKDAGKRRNLFATGWQPYSIQVGDEYFSYGRLEPLGTVMGLTADFMDLFDTMSEGEREDIAAKLSLAVAQNITNKTFMQGLSNALNAVSDPVRYGENWTDRFIGTAIPRGVAALARAEDPIMRDPQTFKEIFKAQLPMLSLDVLPKRDLWGEPIRRTTEGIEALVSPVRRSPIKAKKLDNEMVRLDITVGMPDKSIRGIDLTAEEYDELIKTAGKWSRRRLDAKLRSPGYDGKRDEAKIQLIRKTIMAGRERARGKMFGKIRRKRKQ